MMYVLQVMGGQEEDVVRKLQQQGFEAVVIRENRMIRQRGKWVQQEYIVVPGYVFVTLELTDDTYYRLTEMSGVIRILSTGGKPSPLTPAEVEWVHSCDSILEPSIIEYLDNYTYRVVSGVLLEIQDKIISIDRHRRRVKVTMPMLQDSKILELSYRVL